VFSNGVLVLAGWPRVLIIVFKGDVSALIPLYASASSPGSRSRQAGMVVHHWRCARSAGGRHGHQRRRRRRHRHGADRRGGLEVHDRRVDPRRAHPRASWSALKSIGRHYDRVHDAVRVTADYRPARRTHIAVVLVGSVNQGVAERAELRPVAGARPLLAVSVVGDPAEQEELTKSWDEHNISVELHTIYSPYRELTAHPAVPRRSSTRNRPTT
jgi:hypothetical protein